MDLLRRRMKVEISPYPKGALFSQAPFVFLIFFWVYWQHLELKPFPIGLAIAALGLAAVVMTVRVEHKWSTKEQAFWIVLATVLFFLESRTLFQDRDEQDALRSEQQAAQTMQFDRVLTQNRVQFKKIVEDNKKVFEETKQAADTAEDAVNTITGGKTYCYVDLAVVKIYGKPVDEVSPLIVVRGGKVIRQLTMRVVDEQALQSDTSPMPISPAEIVARDAVSTLIGDVIVGLVPLFRPVGFNTDNHTDKDYQVQFFALNGNWIEILHVRYLNGTREDAIRVTLGNHAEGKVLFQRVSKNYPRTKGKVEWNISLKQP
jgi:hypothetical protein